MNSLMIRFNTNLEEFQSLAAMTVADSANEELPDEISNLT